VNRVVCLIALALMLAGSATPGAAAPATKEDGMEVVLVTGAQPGPALWKVSSGDHVLWILGDVAPLPERMTWRSKKFEQLLANSQEILLDDSDFLLQPESRRDFDRTVTIQTLPRPLTLQEFISPELLARAKAVQRKYDIEGKLEWMRPWYAGSGLYYGACRSLGLIDSPVDNEVRRRARKAKVEGTIISFKPTFEEQVALLADAASDACLSRNVAIIEDGGSGLRRLANAWSLGNISQLRVLVPKYALLNDSWSPSLLNSCKYGGPKRARDFFEKRTAGWHAEIDRALRDNRSTMAVMPIGWLLDPKGYVAQLRARGYEVVEPE